MKYGPTWSAIALAVVSTSASADVITDWNIRTNAFIGDAKMGTPPAMRVVAMVQTAAYSAVLAAEAGRPAASSAAVDAAVAAAHRTMLRKLIPSQQAAIDAAYAAAIAGLPDTPERATGIERGEQAANALLAQRAADNPGAPETYRPHTSAGAYVPTVMPAVTTWPQRKPWLMTSPSQFRPEAPPSLASERWARDYNEVMRIGGKASRERSPEQSEIAQFWEYSLPAIYHGVVRAVADQPGRDVKRNARLFATVAQAMDDALIGVFDAKYEYNFWRPATAIRNGDIDARLDTERDPAWSSLIEAPLHPEYPSAHSSLAGAVSVVLKAELGAQPMPALATSSPTAKNQVRRWTSVEAFAQEVGHSRIYAGIHYRASTEAGQAMGERIGTLAAARLLSESDAISAEDAGSGAGTSLGLR
jgi:hypothetical protein